MKSTLLCFSLLSFGASVALLATPLRAEEATSYHGIYARVTGMPLYSGLVRLPDNPWTESLVFNAGVRIEYAYTYEGSSFGLGVGYHYVSVLELHELLAPLSMARHWKVDKESAAGVVGQLGYMGVVHEKYDAGCLCPIGWGMNHGLEGRILFSYQHEDSDGLAFAFRAGIAIGATSNDGGGKVLQIGTPLELGLLKKF